MKIMSIQLKQSNADKENNFIYHERVPKEEELIEEMKKDGAMCKTKSLAFNPLDRSVCGDDIFGTLLPPTVLKSVSLYEEKKAELKRGVLQEVHHANEELEKFLNKAGYTDLRWILSENGKDSEQMFALPDMLLERNAELTAQPDAIPALLEKLRESCDTSRVAEAKLNTLIGKLRLIDLPRLKNDEGYILISKELDKLHEHLTNAKSNNVALNKAIAAHSSNLQILSSPLSEIRQKLLPKKSETATKSKEEQHLKKIIEKIEEMRNQRAKLLDQLEVELNQDDISKELLAQRDFSHEEIFKKELSKHDETIKYFRLNLMAQEKILHAFTEANADFCDERIVINKNSEDFNKQVMILVTAYDIFKDVSNKVADGEKFYRQLMQRCDQFAIPIHAMEDQFRAEIDKREREKREMEERMNAAKRQREAREALNDFGAPMLPAQNKMYAPPGPVDSGHPRLRDFMDQYRNRSKLAPIQTDQSTQDYLPGPPSPTPSSINEFPISPSVRGSRAASIRDTPILSSQHSPNPQQYLYLPSPQQQPQYHPPPTSSPYQNHQFQHVPNPIQPSTSNSSLSTYSQQQYSQPPVNSPAASFNQNPPANPISNYHQQPTSHQYSHYQQIPPVQFQPAPPNYYPPTSQHQSVPQYNSNSVPPQVQNQHIAPPTSQYAPQFQTAAPVVNQYINRPPQNPPMAQFAPGNPAQFAPGSEVGNPRVPQPQMSSATTQPTSQFAPINQQNPTNPPASQFAPINQSSQIQAPNNSAVPPASQFAPGNPQQFQTSMASSTISQASQFASGSEVTGAQIPQPSMSSATTQPTSQFAPGNPAQFQTPNHPTVPPASQFAPTPALPGNPAQFQTSQFAPALEVINPQIPKSPMPSATIQPTSQFAPGNPQQFHTSQFTAASEVTNPQIPPTSQFAPMNPSSPFVQQQQPSTPLGFSSQPPKSTSPFLANSIQPNASSPWHNAPKQLQTSAWHHQQNQQQQQNQQAQNQKNNVDLLSDLLGDFNLQQPALQPSQHQKQSNPDFSQTTIAQKPAATTRKNSKSELEMLKKLEKRMLHHSIRSNEPLPKIDQSDPLNQINPFQNFPK
ncbi:unnamed protein product [Caenorhabditis angaria]|uniref:ALIX V-shaped domain-containing protein n=1 Tax=Caenorhabditis angaria TaxID=860376 RepID=A0A9P1I4W1_9PELO|nr:unnamed protein product [Caenorhabditis angaria]